MLAILTISGSQAICATL